LALADPPAGIRRFDVLDFSEQGGSKFVHAHAHQPLSLSLSPGMSRVIPNICQDEESFDKFSDGRLAGRRGLGRQDKLLHRVPGPQGVNSNENREFAGLKVIVSAVALGICRLQDFPADCWVFPHKFRLERLSTALDAKENRAAPVGCGDGKWLLRFGIRRK